MKFTVPHRRRRTGKTDYSRRLTLLKSKTPRLVVRKSNKYLSAQLIAYGEQGDLVISSTNSKQLAKFGWKFGYSNLPSAYLLGLLMGTKSKSKKAILDLGLQRSLKGTKLMAVLKGAVDGGLDVRHSPDKFPDENRIKGEHIKTYAAKSSEKGVVFSKYREDKLKVEDMPKIFEEVKNKILGTKNGERTKRK